MDEYENHKDIRYRELHERMRKLIEKNKHIKEIKIKKL